MAEIMTMMMGPPDVPLSIHAMYQTSRTDRMTIMKALCIYAKPGAECVPELIVANGTVTCTSCLAVMHG